jgi:hypothetical protein
MTTKCACISAWSHSRAPKGNQNQKRAHLSCRNPIAVIRPSILARKLDIYEADGSRLPRSKATASLSVECDTKRITAALPQPRRERATFGANPYGFARPPDRQGTTLIDHLCWAGTVARTPPYRQGCAIHTRPRVRARCLRATRSMK